MASSSRDAMAGTVATPGAARRAIERVRGTAREAVEDAIAEEVPVALHYNGQPYAVMMASPCGPSIAIETSEPGWRILDNVVQRNHGAGVTSAGYVRITGNRVLRNGQLVQTTWTSKGTTPF